MIGMVNLLILVLFTSVQYRAWAQPSTTVLPLEEHYLTTRYSHCIYHSEKRRFLIAIFGSPRGGYSVGTKYSFLNTCATEEDYDEEYQLSSGGYTSENDESLKNGDPTPTRYLCGGRLSKMPSWFKSRQESLTPVVHVVNASLFFSSSAKTSSSSSNNQQQQADEDSTNNITATTSATDNNSNEETTVGGTTTSTEAVIERTQAKDQDSWCMLVNFFAPCCPFSAKLAPNYNALARSFPELFVAAIDATQNAKLNLIFGISGTPTIVLFQNGRPAARYDQLDYNHQSLVDFVVKQTDLTPRPDVTTSEEDALGPLSELMKDSGPDYYLMASWYFIAICSVYYFFTSSLADKLLENVRRNWREMNEE